MYKLHEAVELIRSLALVDIVGLAMEALTKVLEMALIFIIVWRRVNDFQLWRESSNAFVLALQFQTTTGLRDCLSNSDYLRLTSWV